MNIELDDKEALLFIELRRINMKNGWVKLNYKDGKIINTDEFRHNEPLVDNLVCKIKENSVRYN